jgi:hypothetical protein
MRWIVAVVACGNGVWTIDGHFTLSWATNGDAGTDPSGPGFVEALRDQLGSRSIA